METMKAAGITAPGGLDKLAYEAVPRPQAGEDEVLVRVHAAAITPTVVSWSDTWKTRAGADRPFPIILGHELAGVVAALGPNVTDLAVGQAVYGFNDWDGQGAQAEYCLARPAQLAPKPQSLDFVQAVEVPISALTAWQALFDHAHLAAGQRVLVQGATGGVGAFAVQLAHRAGAHVIATASTHNLDFARELGADEAVDYTTTHFDEVVRDADVVLDIMGGEALTRSWGVLKPGGVLVTIAAAPSQEEAAAHNVRAVFFVVEPDRQQLVEVGRLIDAGQLRPLVAAVYPLDQAGEDYTRAQQGHMRGKIVLRAAGSMTIFSPRSSSFLDALGPPTEARRGADEVAAAVQGDAALGLGILQLLDAGKLPTGQHRGRGPASLRGLSRAALARGAGNVRSGGGTAFGRRAAGMGRPSRKTARPRTHGA